MELEKTLTVDQIDVTENKCVEVRIKTSIKQNGQEINKTYHRLTVAPGDSYSKQDAQVQAVCAATHTPEVIAAYKQSTIMHRTAETVNINQGQGL